MRLAIATVSETRQLETQVMDPWGYPQLQLMERAALSMAHLVRQLASPPTPIIVMVGLGNNGGDALAMARILQAWGYAPQAYLLSDRLSAAAQQQLEWAKRWGVSVAPWSSSLRLPTHSIVVDGLFGFGLNRAPEGEALQAIELVNHADARAIVAIDLPSGLDGSTGKVLGTAVQATHTVAAGVLKSGLLCDPALAQVGELYLGEIGFPPNLLDVLPGEVIRPNPLPTRRRATHKGEAGSLLVIGGSGAMSGAPAMAALAAGRIGAGLVYVAVPRSIRETVAGLMPEAVVLPMPEDQAGGLSVDAWDTLVPLLDRCNAGLMGPGMGRGAGALAIAKKLAATWDRPMVFDADAIQREVLEVDFPATRLVTPHPGEMGRLMGCSSAHVQDQRIDWAREAATRFGTLTILKGARTIVADPRGSYGVNVTGHPVMATAGSGDILAGMISGLLAQGLAPQNAARQGVAIHGLCGEAIARQSRHGILALDLLKALPEAIAQLPSTLPAGSELVDVTAWAHG